MLKLIQGRVSFLLLVTAFVFQQVYAESYVPKSAQTVVATWTLPKPAKQPKVFIAQLLSDASLPGLASRYYGRADALLKPLLTKNPDDIELQFFFATVLQHYHQFEPAQQVLTSILKQQPRHVAAWLMKANIHMVQGDLENAKRACLSVLGHASLLVSTACVLEVNAEQGQVAQSYQQLQHVVSIAGDIPLEEDLWLRQILADLAQRLAQPKEAIAHLSGVELAQMPVSYLALWADIHLSEQQSDIVLSKLGPIVLASDSFDDALLLRLSLAEQAKVNHKNSAANVWQQRLKQRITIRLQRNDTAHAADIARYYLDISPNATQALHWAKINWQQAKLNADKVLLERATKALALAEVTNQI